MTIQEKTEKLQAIVAEQKEILESKVGKDGIFDAFRKLSRLKYLEVQKQMLMDIPAKRMLPGYAKGAIVGSNDKPEMIIGNTSSPTQTSFRGITAKEFAENANSFAKMMQTAIVKAQPHSK